MQVQFDERVNKAIDILWVKLDKKQGKKALELLTEAADSGDGDACFFLARCYFGPCYINPKFGFPEDDAKGEEYLEKSLKYGSAVGMFGARRVGGFEPERGSFIYPPFTSDKQIWKEVYEKAAEGTGAGALFCKYMVANAYYYGDVMELMEIPEEEMSAEHVEFFMLEAARLYEECLRSGFGFGLSNLIDIYLSGDYIPTDLKKVWEIKMLAKITRIKHLLGMFK